MSKVNVAQGLHDFNGTPLRQNLTVQHLLQFIDIDMMPRISGDPGDLSKRLDDMRKPTTLKSIIFDAIGSGMQAMSGEEKFKLYQIGTKVAASDEVELKAEEIALLKRAIEKHYTSPLYVGLAWSMLEGTYQGKPSNANSGAGDS